MRKQGIEPGFETPLRIESIEAPVSPEKSFLRSILCILVVGQDIQGKSHGPVPVPLHEQTIRFPFPPRQLWTSSLSVIHSSFITRYAPGGGILYPILSAKAFRDG
jgi:hypothetical protein